MQRQLHGQLTFERLPKKRISLTFKFCKLKISDLRNNVHPKSLIINVHENS